MQPYFDRAMWSTFAMLLTDLLMRAGVSLIHEIEMLP